MTQTNKLKIFKKNTKIDNGLKEETSKSSMFMGYLNISNLYSDGVTYTAFLGYI